MPRFKNDLLWFERPFQHQPLLEDETPLLTLGAPMHAGFHPRSIQNDLLGQEDKTN